MQGTLARSAGAGKRSRSALALALLTLLAVVPAQADEVRLRVGIYQNSPKVGLSASGQPEGVFVDLLQAIAQAEGWQLEFVPGTWAEGLDRLAAGDLDLMPDVAYTQGREELYDFHREPVLSDWFQVYARRGSAIRSLLDLHGKRVAVLDRSIQQDALTKALVGFDLQVHLIAKPDYAAAFAAVQQGQVDAVVANRFYGTVQGRLLQLEDTAVIFSPTRLFFAAPKGRHRALLNALDSQLALLKADPTSAYYQTLQRWTSEPLPRGLPAWIKWAIPAASCLLLLALAWSIVLRRQVRARTQTLAQRNAELLTLNEQMSQAEHALRELNANLEQRVTERTAELAEARERAETADRLKSAFLATMSHELRTPLNSIIGFTGLILQGLAGPLTAEQRRQLDMVAGSSRHLLALINDILDISKIEAGQLQVNHAAFDLRGSLARAADLVAPLAARKGLTLDVRPAPELGDVVSDQRRVEQVLLNLLNNAVKFTERGHVTLTASVLADGAGPSPGPVVCMTVADTGIGIKAEDLNQLFLPFRQIDTGLARQHEGTGLGLAICRRLATLLGGEVRASSVWGQGSEFTFLLPVKGAAPNDRHHPADRR